MNAEPIRGRTARNAQNEHMLNLQTAACKAVDGLMKSGFTVLRVVLDASRPVIWIQNCTLCARLKGMSVVRRSGPSGHEQVMAALFEGCQVQWTIRGH